MRTRALSRAVLFTTVPLVASSLLVSAAGAAIIYKSKFGKSLDDGGAVSGPWDVAVDAGGDILTADPATHTIQKFDSDGKFLDLIGELSTGSNHSGDGQLYYPEAVATDTAGNFLYVADTANSRIQVFSAADGAFVRKWGPQVSGTTDLGNPGGIALDAQDNVYVTDTRHQRIVKFSSSGTFIKEWGTPGTGDGEFKVPVGIAFNSAKNTLYVTDEFIGRFQEFTLDGGFLNEYGLDNTGTGYLLNYPDEITVDAIGGLVYVAEAGDSQEVSVFDINKTPNESFVADFTGDLDPSSSFGYSTHGVYFNPDNGELLVASTYYQKIYRFHALGTPLIEVDPDTNANHALSRGKLELDVSHDMMVGSCNVKATGTMKTPQSDPVFDGQTWQLNGPRGVVQSKRVLEYSIKLNKDQKDAIRKTRAKVTLTFDSPDGCNGGVDTPKPVKVDYSL